MSSGVWLVEVYRGTQMSFILSSSPEEEVSIAQVAAMIARNFEYQDRLVLDGTRADGQLRKTADNARLRAAYGRDLGLVPLSTGIAKVVRWFCDHYDTGTIRV